jgi:hypothetical protein
VALDLEELDKAFPVLVRYTGWAVTVVLIGFCLAGFYVQAAPGFVAAGSMILYKSLRDAVHKEGEEGVKTRKKGDDLSDW